ncbi:unnamed protein product [Arctogadus glacialis]
MPVTLLKHAVFSRRQGSFWFSFFWKSVKVVPHADGFRRCIGAWPSIPTTAAALFSRLKKEEKRLFFDAGLVVSEAPPLPYAAAGALRLYVFRLRSGSLVAGNDMSPIRVAEEEERGVIGTEKNACPCSIKCCRCDYSTEEDYGSMGKIYIQSAPEHHITEHSSLLLFPSLFFYR